MRGIVKTAFAMMSVVLSVLLTLLLARSALAATNQALDPGGGNVVLTSSGLVTVNGVPLMLVTQAHDLAGVNLPNGATVAPGQVIYFVLYVDNVTAFAADDIRITNLLNEAQFSYVPNSLETTVMPTGSTNAVIWAGAWSSLTDGVGAPDDVASFTDNGDTPALDRLTIGAVSGQANQVLSMAGNVLRAVRFRVIVN